MVRNIFLYEGNISPKLSKYKAAASPPPQTVVIQPGEIDPTETTVITVHANVHAPPASAAAQPCPRRTAPPAPPHRVLADPFADFEEAEGICPPRRRRELGALDMSILTEDIPTCPQRPEAIAGLGTSPCPRSPVSSGFATDSPHPAFRSLESISPTTAPVEGGVCARLPQTTVCPTPVRTVTARPISTNPNVSVLDDSFDEADLITDADFGGGYGIDDFHLVHSAPVSISPFGPPRVISPPRLTSPPPAAVTPPPCPSLFPDMDVSPRTPVADVYEQIERNKEAFELQQMERNKAFLRACRVMREDDPGRVTDRIMTGYYRAADPVFAEAYREEWGTGEVPVSDLLGDLGTPTICPEVAPYSSELLEAMREPEFGAYGSELLSSNLQVNPPRECPPGAYSYELLQNVHMAPTTGYCPGPLGSELMAHVDWSVPLMPEPQEVLLEPFPCPPTGPTDPYELADLIDW